MTARHWMEIAALASALGLTGTAAAQSTYGITSTDDSRSVSNYGVEAPSSGAIVTPEDKAPGMGKDNADVRNQRRDANDDMSDDNALNNDELGVNGSASVPPRTGSDVRPGDMGPGNVRGE